MIAPNARVAAMASYALPDLSVPDGVEPVVLAQNEHAYAPSPRVREAVIEAMGRAQLYPDSEWQALRQAIARVHELEFDNIVCGAGSMELMSSLMLAYFEPGQKLVVSEYGYLFMRTLARLIGAELEVAAEPDYRVDVDAILEKADSDTRMVFVVNPGNPCGSVIHNDEIRRLRDGLGEDVLLLVDEAYAEYVDAGFHPPLFDLIDRGNTVITRTFSKIYGLAGLRVGWGYFPDAVRDQVRKVINPSSVSLLSQVAATAAMQDQDGADAVRHETAAQRDALCDAIAQLGLRALPSQTNFVLVDFESPTRAAAAFEYLRQRGIVLRPMGGYGLPQCLRITIGTPAQMQLTAAALSAWQADGA